MIPYRIFIAAFLTLLIILNKMILTKSRNSRMNSLIFKMTIGTVYYMAVFYWILSIFSLSTKWYAYVISAIIALCAFVYYYFVYLYNDKIIKPQGTYYDYIGKIGTIISKIDNGYIGQFNDTKELVIVNAEENFNIHDKFQISEIKDGKIMIIKYINNE